VPKRARSVEAALIGRAPDAGTVGAAAARVMDDVDPADDEHASAWYRARVAPVAVARAVTAALGSRSDP
jgi:carbon-monoxide dehydrogenase medium subunit